MQRNNNAVAHELAAIGLEMRTDHRMHMTYPDKVKPIYNEELAAIAAAA